MQRTTISLAVEFDPNGTFTDLLRSHRENDDEVPMHSADVNLFTAIATGMLPKAAYPHIDHVLGALEDMGTEGVPGAWARVIGGSLFCAADESVPASLLGEHRYRNYARLAALARFDDADKWLTLWNDHEVGRIVFAEITTQNDAVDWATPAEIAARVRANIAVLENMRADGVDLSVLGARFGHHRGTYVPLLHSAASQGNTAMVHWLLEAGMDPRQRVRDPMQSAQSGAEFDAFDAARAANDAVLPTLLAWESRNALRRVLAHPR